MQTNIQQSSIAEETTIAMVTKAKEFEDELSNGAFGSFTGQRVSGSTSAESTRTNAEAITLDTKNTDAILNSSDPSGVHMQTYILENTSGVIAKDHHPEITTTGAEQSHNVANAYGNDVQAVKVETGNTSTTTQLVEENCKPYTLDKQ